VLPERDVPRRRDAGAPAAGRRPDDDGDDGRCADVDHDDRPCGRQHATMIVVENPMEKLRPGMTATVALDGSRVDRAVRIPNAALSFRPPADVLAAIRQ